MSGTTQPAQAASSSSTSSTAIASIPGASGSGGSGAPGATTTTPAPPPSVKKEKKGAGGPPKSKAYANPIASRADEVKYRTKYKQLKGKVKEIEEENAKIQIKILKTKRQIQRLRLERSILYDRFNEAKSGGTLNLLLPHHSVVPQPHPIPTYHASYQTNGTQQLQQQQPPQQLQHQQQQHHYHPQQPSSLTNSVSMSSSHASSSHGQPFSNLTYPHSLHGQDESMIT